jgi:hypothetical protein
MGDAINDDEVKLLIQRQFETEGREQKEGRVRQQRQNYPGNSHCEAHRSQGEEGGFTEVIGNSIHWGVSIN